MPININRREFFKFAGITAGIVAGSGKVSSAKASIGTGEVGDMACMLYDATKCVGCRACQTACRGVNDKAPEVDVTGLYDTPIELSGDTWTIIQLYKSNEDDSDWSFVKHNCMHCVDPACVNACTIGALQKTPDGPVTYDDSLCFGCRYCMVACPFDVPKYEWDTNSPFVQKCDFCVSNGRMEAGDGPACVDVCPTDALAWGSRDDMLAQAHTEIEANPDKYFENRVYGEHEVGGTSQLVLSPVAFEKLGLPTADSRSLPELTKIANWSVPAIIVGMGGLMSAIYWGRTRNEQPEEAHS